MEDDTEILEDGEILEGCDTSSSLPNQFSVSRLSREPQTICSDESSNDNSDDTDDDSDEQSSNPKRLKQVTEMPVRSQVPNKYKVWCQALQEEALTETLTMCDVEAIDRERSVESYNYKLVDKTDYTDYKTYGRPNRRRRHRHHADDEYFEEDEKSLAIGSKRRHGDIKKRLGHKKSQSRGLQDLSVTVDDSSEEVADDIAKKLKEKKTDLILNVVLVLGKEKAIELYNETKGVEDNGGMFLMNGERRRTAGGVFLLLLKRDSTIPSDATKKIFLDDVRKTIQNRKKCRRIKHKKKQAELKETLIREKLLCLNTAGFVENSELKQPSALSGTEDNLLEEGEVEAEHTVSNPPPSPVTDQDTPPPHTFSEDEGDRRVTQHNLKCGRQIINYENDDDDYLEVDVEPDDMDML